jgi:hypothetical protein
MEVTVQDGGMDGETVVPATTLQFKVLRVE